MIKGTTVDGKHTTITLEKGECAVIINENCKADAVIPIDDKEDSATTAVLVGASIVWGFQNDSVHIQDLLASFQKRLEEEFDR